MSETEENAAIRADLGEKTHQLDDEIDQADKQSNAVEYSVSPGLASRLQQLNISLAFTSYQSGIVYLIGRNAQNGINVHQSAMPKPMGIAKTPKASDCDDYGLLLIAHHTVLRLENILQPDQRINNSFDACFVPRLTHVTGYLDAHDVGLDKDGQAIFVNTRYNCLATTSHRHSFKEVWRPPFITELVDEDRCHLNGLAMKNGEPDYVTAVSRSNTIDGWRDRRASGGIVINVKNNEIVSSGLSMPHSPRWHDDKLWLLNSGTGELGFISPDNPSSENFEPVAFCPGFLRGLAFYENLAFVGLSKPRYKRFEGLELDQRLQDADSEPWCGVQIIDLAKGSCVDWFRIDGQVSELYDLEVLPNTMCPMAIAPHSDEAVTLISFEGMKV